jgi:ABC-type transporter Mla subunit MlaD
MEFFTKYKKPILISIGILLSSGLLFTLTRSMGNGAPVAFSESRMQGALIAQAIVGASKQSAVDLEKINELDKNGKFDEALDLVKKTIEKSQQIREQAVKLSEELQKMAQAVSGVRSEAARQAAIESVSSHLSLISRLINYSDYLDQLLEVLRNRFSGNFVRAGEVADLIKNINTEISAINDFNAQAEKAMEQFDSLVK